ncbi:MAG TPA: hypothetical protein VEF89_06650 [Solirubrobacteraceae bacterium]|nr:hypothetical protein [Solirubrobacteraceae bacterium]
MKGNRKRRSVWLRLAFAIVWAIAAHALGGSAQAATMTTASDATGQPATVLAGFTSQNYPAFFKLSADGRRMTVGGIALGMTCTSGNQFVLQDAFLGVRINANGRIRGSYTQAPTSGQDGATVSATDSLTARVNRSRTQLSGVWHLDVHYAFSDGTSDDCDSGPVRFTATG